MTTQRPIYRRVDIETVRRLLLADGYRILGDLSPGRILRIATRAGRRARPSGKDLHS